MLAGPPPARKQTPHNQTVGEGPEQHFPNCPLNYLNFIGGMELTLPEGPLDKLGLKEGPEVSDAKESKLLAALTETVDFEAGDLMEADLDDPALETDLAEGVILVVGFKATGDNTTRGDFFWI